MFFGMKFQNVYCKRDIVSINNTFSKKINTTHDWLIDVWCLYIPTYASNSLDLSKPFHNNKTDSYLCSIRCTTMVRALMKCCVGVFTDLGGDYSVVRKSLLYKGLSSWRRLLVSNINCPTVYPVLLTNTLQKSGKEYMKTQSVREINRHQHVNCNIWSTFQDIFSYSLRSQSSPTWW